MVQVNFQAPKGYIATPLEHAAAAFLMPMLMEGTMEKDKATIANFVARHGSFLQQGETVDAFLLNLTTTPTALPQMLPLFAEIVSTPAFTEESFLRQKKLRQQELLLREANPTFLAGRALEKMLFGEGYAYILESDHIDKLQLHHLVDLYKKRGWYPGVVTVSGKVTEAMVADLKRELAILPKVEKPPYVFPPPRPSEEKRCTIPKAGAQSSLALAMPTINWRHPDYFAFIFLHYILGGPSLSSRLMQRVREKDARTYGIASHIERRLHATVFLIKAQVKKGYAKETCEAIFGEIKALQEVPLSPQELQSQQEALRGYLIGLCDNKGALAKVVTSLALCKIKN